MKNIPLSKDEKTIVFNLHKIGKTVPEIATTINRPNATIYNLLKKNNIVANTIPDIFSIKQKDQMKDLYLKGVSLDKIALRFNCKRSVVRLRLAKMGVTIRPKNEKINLPQHIINKIIDEYQYERATTYELAIRYDVSTTKITSILRENNIDIHPVGRKYAEDIIDEAEKLTKLGLYGWEIAQKLDVSEAWISHKFKERGIKRNRGPKPNIKNIGYFDNINSEDKAYFLGLLVADGCIREQKYSIYLILQSEDADAILGFTRYIGADGHNKYLGKRKEFPKWKKTYGVRIFSKHMYFSLINLGLKPRKSSKEVMPNIPKNLIPHFIRGYFDGDGVTCVGPSRKYSGFVGSKEILTQIQYHLGTNLTIHEKTGTNIFTGGIQFSKELYDYMYSNATIWMDRKRRKMDKICNYSSDKWPKNNIIPQK